MLIHRILSALVGIPLLIISVWLGGWYLAGVIAIVAVAGAYEFNKMAISLGYNSWLPGMVAGVLLFVAATMVGQLEIGFVFTLLIFIFLFRIIFKSHFNMKDAAVLLIGTMYVGWLLSHLIMLRETANGFYYVIMVFVATWMTDTMAYFVGLALGKHKLAPAISPNKTIEGALGGVMGSVLGSISVAYFLGVIPIAYGAVLGLLIGVIGQGGDLVESAMKRSAAVKDSGNLIPGHGGILDRFDSLLFTAPLVYYFVQVFIIN